MREFFCLFLSALLLASPLYSIASEEKTDRAEYRGWIEEMKTTERGPFSRIRWFCNDGTVLPPKAYTCAGFQHGEWNDKTRRLREQGYWIANLLAGTDPGQLLQDPQFFDLYAQILIERYLVGADDGWILRRALFYRGAIQEEDEREASRALLTSMASKSEWIGVRFPALRAGALLLPHGEDTASVQKVRQMSASLSDRDQQFQPVRAKIHGAPEASDAMRVREYAAAIEDEDKRQRYLELANEIDFIYQSEPLHKGLDELAAEYANVGWLQELLSGNAESLRDDDSAPNRFSVTAGLLADLRRSLPLVWPETARLEILDLGLRLESENFRAASELRSSLEQQTRRQRIAYLDAAAMAAYGTGVINQRLLREIQQTLQSLTVGPLGLDRYLDALGYLGRVPGWGTQVLRMYFFNSMGKLAEIEPMAMLFIQDHLRGSPLLFFSSVLDGLSRDANRLAGVKHVLFGDSVGVGFTALNPGMVAGVLHVEPDLSDPENFSSDGIYVLQETVSDLPPVAGILTEGEGNPLSHVQLLARNLGIPNVAVDSSLKQTLNEHNGERVVLAVSKSGLVELSAWDDRWSDIFAEAGTGQGVQINPDLEKLDLTVRSFLPLDNLRASDSGRIVGPKAAKLGELRAHYPGHVSRGVAIPFGLFRQEALDQPYPGGEGTVFDWMVRNYQMLEGLPKDDPRRSELTEGFRSKLYDIIASTRPGVAFQQQLKTAMSEAFGSDHPPGVFVRSDTNVEDLAGFTGAGLNLTLPNVVDFDKLLNGIVRVWASPFTARAFAWRQSHMTRPEHVYTSILLLESVASDKSGVLVTQDIDTGKCDMISVAVNEGIGGAVDGQAAESLRIALDGSYVRVLATATAPFRRVPAPNGDLQSLPTSGSDVVLQPGEIAQLIDFAKGLPQKFPAITDDEGHPAPADVEFGFVDGDLRLFQIRPFLDSKMARGITYLQEMDARLADTGSITVDIEGLPK